MKYFIIIAVLFGVVFTSPVLKKNHPKNSVEECIPEIFGVHVRSSHHVRDPVFGEVQQEVVSYKIPGKPSGVYISCITAKDLREFQNNYLSEIKIISGGLYQNMVEFLITSDISNGYEYEIDIELNRPPIDYISE